MNRRDFIKTMLALGASITLPIDLAASTDSAIAEAWESSGFAFDVQEYGAIWVSDFNESATREEAYGFSIGDADFRRPQGLIQFAESSPLNYRLQDIYEDYRCELQDIAESGPSAAAGRAAKKRLARLPDDPDYGWQVWLKVEQEKAWVRLRPEIEQFLEEAPDWSELEHLPESANAQGAAFLYFRDCEDPGVLDQLGIIIIEGDCPGSTYFAAELTIPVDEANRIARENDYPYRFRQS